MNRIKEESFRGSCQGKPTGLYTLENRNGIIAQITNYGGIIVSIIVPDRKGEFADIVQGYDTIEEYINGNSPYMGAMCGRCANRISKGKFSLEGKDYTLAVNNGPNHLHGGIAGFSKKVWDVVSYTPSVLKLEYLSADGEEGYPGNLTITITYTLNDKNELHLDYLASSDKTTVLNIAGHSYFNLAGEGSGKVYDQELMINAGFYTPMDETSIPTGEIRTVRGTPFDFTSSKKIGQDIDMDDEQLKYGAGYDHNFVLDHRTGELGLAAVAHDPGSGRVLEVCTTQPGLQLYTANWIDGEKGKGGKRYGRRWAFALEAQHFPDSVNIHHFPSAILKKGQKYRHSCIYRFGVR